MDTITAEPPTNLPEHPCELTQEQFDECVDYLFENQSLKDLRERQDILLTQIDSFHNEDKNFQQIRHIGLKNLTSMLHFTEVAIGRHCK